MIRTIGIAPPVVLSNHGLRAAGVVEAILGIADDVVVADRGGAVRDIDAIAVVAHEVVSDGGR